MQNACKEVQNIIYTKNFAFFSHKCWFMSNIWKSRVRSTKMALIRRLSSVGRAPDWRSLFFAQSRFAPSLSVRVALCACVSWSFFWVIFWGLSSVLSVAWLLRKFFWFFVALLLQSSLGVWFSVASLSRYFILTRRFAPRLASLALRFANKKTNKHTHTQERYLLIKIRMFKTHH